VFLTNNLQLEWEKAKEIAQTMSSF
jgi:hypothetical protein